MSGEIQSTSTKSLTHSDKTAVLFYNYGGNLPMITPRQIDTLNQDIFNICMIAQGKAKMKFFSEGTLGTLPAGRCVGSSEAAVKSLKDFTIVHRPDTYIVFACKNTEKGYGICQEAYDELNKINNLSEYKHAIQVVSLETNEVLSFIEVANSQPLTGLPSADL